MGTVGSFARNNSKDVKIDDLKRIFWDIKRKKNGVLWYIETERMEISFSHFSCR